MVYANGDTYAGGFNAQKLKHGRGVYTWGGAAAAGGEADDAGGVAAAPPPPPTRYEGQYANGKRQGLGKMFFPNGERYHGALARVRA